MIGGVNVGMIVQMIIEMIVGLVVERFWKFFGNLCFFLNFLEARNGN